MEKRLDGQSNSDFVEIRCGPVTPAQLDVDLTAPERKVPVIAL